MKIVMDKEEILGILKNVVFGRYHDALDVETIDDIELVESYNIQWGDYTFRKVVETAKDE